MTRKEELTARAIRIVSENASHRLYPLADEIRKALLQVEREVFKRVIEKIETEMDKENESTEESGRMGPDCERLRGGWEMNRLSKEGERQIEARFAATHEAVHIFKLVVAEWKSDPTSVQCFDSRIVEQAKLLDAKLKKLDPLY